MEHLRWFAQAVFEKNASKRKERVREIHLMRLRSCGGTFCSSDIPSWVLDSLITLEERHDYIDDQFPEGSAFKYLGQDSYSLGADGGNLRFHTKTPNGVDTITISGEHAFNLLSECRYNA